MSILNKINQKLNESPEKKKNSLQIEEAKLLIKKLSKTASKLSDFVVAKTLFPGDPLGERAISEYRPRQETCVASKDTVFAIFGRTSYCKILNRQIDSRNKKIAVFLRQIQFM